MNGNNTAIQLKNLSKTYKVYNNAKERAFELFLLGTKKFYREHNALENINLTISKGETVGIIGTNGAGKSTLLRVLAGLSPASSGTIQINGKTSALLDLGAGFNPDFTGRYNIYMSCALLGMTREEIDKNIENIIAFSELNHFIDAPMKTYSSGMYMRLGFSIATALNPEILLIDEVLAVGDEYFQNKCIDKIGEMRRKGVTVLLVTHSMGWVKTMCSRALWIKDGIIEKDGNPRMVVDSYLNYIKEIESSPECSDSCHIRTGSKQAVFEKVSFLNDSGEKTEHIKSGEKLTVRLEYNAFEKIKKPTFGMSIYNVTGELIYGFASKGDRTSPDYIFGKGILKIVFPSLNLLGGDYLISLGLMDEESVKAYDFHEKLYSLKVEQENTDEGVIFLEHFYNFENSSDEVEKK